MAIQDIPFEVWLNIARFIPVDELQRLYGVNHILFNIAMDERYKVVRFEYRRRILRNVDILMDDNSASQRVRVLQLLPQIIPTLASIYRYLPRRIQYINTITRAVRRDPSPSAQATTNMLRVISGMKNLTELDLIRCRHCRDLPDLIAFLPVVKMGWVTFGHNLQHLTLDITLEGCEYILTPSLTFPRLEQFVFALSQAYRTTDSKRIMNTILVPFVDRHHLTLQSLKISSYDYLDICGMLGTLQHLQRLRELELDLLFASMQQTNTGGLQRVLELHAKSLRNLGLNFRTVKLRGFAPPWTSQWFQQEFLQVPLPNLQSLQLEIRDFVTDIDRTTAYLRQFQSTITTLVLKTQVLSLHEVDVIVSLFAEEDTLRALGITVAEFCPDLLGLLSKKLPGLQHLEVEFDIFFQGLEHTDPLLIPIGTTGHSQFCDVMRGRSYPYWKLRHLNAVPSDYILGDVTECRQVIRKAIPGLETLEIGYKDRAKSFAKHLG